MTAPSKAQIEAARKMLQLSSCFGREVCTLMPCACAETMAALTAAAEVKPKTDFIEIRLLKAERDELKYQLAATIERCAQVADRLCCSKCDDIVAAIRALATKAESR